jgi:disulfide bond formation protein DsbB
MEILTSSANMVWSVLSIVAQILSVVFFIALFVPKLRASKFVKALSDRAVLVAFIVSLLATIGSLIYSDVIGYAPCKLCWFQRIFMYPQVIIMGIALFRNDVGVRISGFILSAIGAAIALFHWTGQLGLTPLPCSAVGYSVSCAERFVLQFGYITIPLMAFSAFILMTTTFALALKRSPEVPEQNL